ncbi:hypothetical protein [Francisella sp. SYW-9]|uniref:hypothetical protein n=1 Tax=Francisella sp. SYW-9 TaxID=2610888 RepID=UPI00123D9689|nr:hypothetical protein [Francisella sp. SYW-9]
MKNKIIGLKDSDFMKLEDYIKIEEEDNLVLKENKTVVTYDHIKIGSNTEYFKTQKIPLVQKNKTIGILGLSTNNTENRKVLRYCTPRNYWYLDLLKELHDISIVKLLSLTEEDKNIYLFFNNIANKLFFDLEPKILSLSDSIKMHKFDKFIGRINIIFDGNIKVKYPSKFIYAFYCCICSLILSGVRFSYRFDQNEEMYINMEERSLYLTIPTSKKKIDFSNNLTKAVNSLGYKIVYKVNKNLELKLSY